MRKLSLIGWIGLIVLLGLGTSAWAATSEQTGVSISFYDGPAATAGDQIDPKIPDGHTAYRVTTPTTTQPRPKTASMGAWLQALRHGQLPQTNEYQTVYWQLLGGLVLIIIGLLLIIGWQIRQQRKQV